MKIGIVTLSVVAGTIIAFLGYVLNIAQLCQCDFGVPIKAEVVRVIGVCIPPVGAVVGWCDVNDTPKL